MKSDEPYVEGPLGNRGYQKAREKHDRELRAFEISDLEKILATDYGRRFYYRVVFEVCSIHGPSADLNIKDGYCAGLHSFFKDGMRYVGRILELEAWHHFPELWNQALNERLSRNRYEMEERAKLLEEKHHD